MLQAMQGYKLKSAKSYEDRGYGTREKTRGQTREKILNSMKEKSEELLNRTH